MRQNGLVLLGGGGHAKSCRDIVDSMNGYSISQHGRVQILETINDTRELSDTDWKYLSEHFSGFILGVGMIHDTRIRNGIIESVFQNGGSFVTLISPYARVSPSAHIKDGTIVMANAAINYGAVVEEFCIINTGAIIEHDAAIGVNTHISTGAVVNGDCKIGRRCFIGSNAVLLNQISVCEETTVGAGSVVVKNIDVPGGIYVGNHAIRIKEKS